MSAPTAKIEMPLRERSKGRATVRDKDATLAAILSAAESEFARYGLQGTRVESIARNAGVTKGLIFHYFESKEHLFEAVLTSSAEPLKAVIAEVEESDASPADLLHLLVERFLQTIEARPLSPLIFTLEMIQNRGEHFLKLNLPSLSGTLERVLAKGIEQGCFRKLDTTQSAINIVALCTHYFFAVNLYPDPHLHHDPYDKSKLARHASEVMRFVEAGTAAVQEQICEECKVT